VGRQPDEPVVDALALPVEGLPLAWVVANLVHGSRVEEAAVDHHQLDVLRQVQILQRIPRDDE
jgi:hypothetical protein